MIQRYTISSSREAVAEKFAIKVNRRYKPNYNAKPGDLMPVITNDKKDKIQLFQWGLVPYDAIDPNIGEKLCNARTEIVFAKRPFSKLIDKQRCYVLADGFYVWQKDTNTPFRVTLKNNDLFVIAGVWERWENEYEEGTFFTSFSMLTLESSPYLSHLTKRMPAIIQPDKEKKWFQKNYRSVMSDLFVSGDAFEINKVSTDVNDVKNNHIKLLNYIDETKNKDKNNGELTLF